MKSLSLCLLIALIAPMLPGCRAKTSFQGAGAADPMPAPAAPVNPDPMPAPAPIPIPVPASPFQVTASAAKTQFAVGEAIPLVIEIKNSSEQAVDLNFTSGQKFDFSATPAGETDAIWSYGMNKRFIQALSTVTLKAGKSLRYETVWRNAKGGNYTIGAKITANGGLEAAPFEIAVK